MLTVNAEWASFLGSDLGFESGRGIYACLRVSGGVPNIAKSDCYVRHVCLSVRMEHLGSHETDFSEIW